MSIAGSKTFSLLIFNCFQRSEYLFGSPQRKLCPYTRITNPFVVRSPITTVVYVSSFMITLDVTRIRISLGTQCATPRRGEPRHRAHVFCFLRTCKYCTLEYRLEFARNDKLTHENCCQSAPFSLFRYCQKCDSPHWTTECICVHFGPLRVLPTIELVPKASY
jgi:hypothetical protein